MSIEILQEKCFAYMEKESLNQARLAKKIGIGDSTFSRWLKGTYPNPEAITKKVEVFFEKEGRRGETSSVGEIRFEMTSMSEKIINVLDYCRVMRINGVVYGDAGVGKTLTCMEWAKDKPDVVMITADPVFSNLKAFLKHLARALKTKHYGPTDEILVDIRDHLKGRDTLPFNIRELDYFGLDLS